MLEAASLKLGDTVAYWDEAGKLHEAVATEVGADGTWISLVVHGDDMEARYVPAFGRRDQERRRCFEVPEHEPFDPLAPAHGAAAPAKPTDTCNPLSSVEQWMTGVGHESQAWRLYESLCFEEASEWVGDLSVTDAAGFTDDEGLEGREALRSVLSDLGEILRKHDDLHLHTSDRNRLVDHHLDVVWVNLCAAAAIMGGDHSKLREAWSRLHKANVDEKKVNGKYVLDRNNKVVKPAGWMAPDYSDLINQEN